MLIIPLPAASGPSSEQCVLDEHPHPEKATALNWVWTFAGRHFLFAMAVSGFFFDGTWLLFAEGVGLSWLVTHRIMGWRWVRPLAVAGSIAAGWMFYWTVERPFMQPLHLPAGRLSLRRLVPCQSAVPSRSGN